MILNARADQGRTSMNQVLLDPDHRWRWWGRRLGRPCFSRPVTPTYEVIWRTEAVAEGAGACRSPAPIRQTDITVIWCTVS